MSSVLIIGKPNSGKSLLFNKLTGVFQKVSNFPGVTVEVKKAKANGISIEDYPGIYSLNPLTKDEELAVRKFKEAVKNETTKMVVCVLDVTRLERSLSLGHQIRQLAAASGKHIVFALNMFDEIQKKKIDFDLNKLEEALQAKVLPVSARTEYGIQELKNYLHSEEQKAQSLRQEFFAEQPTEFARSTIKELKLNSEIFIQTQNKIDKFMLNNFLGGLAFFAVMMILFESIFTWASPAMDMTEELIAFVGSNLSASLSDGIFKDFVNDAIFGGVGSFLVFVPQIVILTFIIGILEDSGYLARAAIICHKPFSYFGMTGKSFVPILTGHACAIPAIFATRTIESPKRRLLTLLTVPLTACSARLPVYTLLIAATIPNEKFLGGLIGLRGFSFFVLYFAGIFLALIVAGVLSKTIYKKEDDSPFVLELPAYRLPHWRPLIQRSGAAAFSFIKNAGGIIFVVSVGVWVLGYFPNGPEQLDSSWLASLGKWVEPIFSPLGIDWKFGVAILTSFLAREVFVGTLGTMLGIEGADENIAGLAENLQASGMTLATGVSLLVFYAIAMQCVSTLAVIKKETDSLGYAVGVFFSYGILAYIMALASYWILV